MFEKPVIGINKCLLGENVRHNGVHQLDQYLRGKPGNTKKRSISIIYNEYASALIKAFQKLAAVQKNTNVLTVKTEK